MPITLDEARRLQPAIERDILTFVDAESYSYDLPKLSESFSLIDAFVTSTFPSATLEREASEDYGDTLIVRLPGTSGTNVLFVGHYDTVWPTGTLREWGEREYTDDAGERRLTGPGIFDMKTGLAEMLWVAKLVQDSSTRPTITLLINGDEELGSPFSQPIIEREARAVDMALVFEATAAGKVKTSRKGVANIDITATGVEAHAGLEPEKGASAIDALAQACVELKKLEDLEKGTTLNIGLINGGSGANVVAGKATARVDIRFWDDTEPTRLEQGARDITWSDDRAQVDFEFQWNRPPMVAGENTERLFELMRSQAADLGLDLEDVAVGGASDANFIAAAGTPVICGLGAVGAGAHARHEFIYPDRIPEMVAVVANTVEAL